MEERERAGEREGGREIVGELHLCVVITALMQCVPADVPHKAVHID